jgi:hypothetical protein
MSGITALAVFAAVVKNAPTFVKNDGAAAAAFAMPAVLAPPGTE